MLSWLNPKKFITIPYQVVLLIIITVLLLLSLLYPIYTFYPRFVEPEIHHISSESIKALGKTPTKVLMGLSLIDFIDFNIRDNIFEARAIIWFEYDPSKVSVEQLGNFYLARGTVVEKKGPIISKFSENLSRAVYHVQLKYRTLMDYAWFPFDDHRVFLEIINPYLNSQEVILETTVDSWVLPEKLNLGGWQVVQHKTNSGVINVPLTTDVNSTDTLQEIKAYFSLGVTRRDFRLLLLILLPLLLIFYFGVFSLSLAGSSALSLSLSSVSGLIAYRYVIRMLEPSVSYFMLSDYLFLMLLAESFVIFTVNLFTSLSHSKIADSRVHQIKGATLIVLYVILLVGWFYLTHFIYGSF